jgi:hypothetical protein
MNIELVDSLVNIILALSPEERQLLNEKLTPKSNWQSLRAKILENAQEIQQRIGGQAFEPGIDEIITQMREERDEELIAALFPHQEKS